VSAVAAFAQACSLALQKFATDIEQKIATAM
jgi:hypothetical protein